MVKVNATLAMLETLAIEAGQIILRIRANGSGARLKPDGSPVTDADQAAEEHITAGLQRIDPGAPIIAEECACYGDVQSISTDRFFLVDPLDGTKEFIKGRSDFTVNISVIEGGVPRLGVVVAPARNELFSGGYGIAYRCRISADGTVDERENNHDAQRAFCRINGRCQRLACERRNKRFARRMAVNEKTLHRFIAEVLSRGGWYGGRLSASRSDDAMGYRCGRRRLAKRRGLHVPP